MSKPSRFWDARILDWEAGRYDGALHPRLGPAEVLAGWFSAPTRLRQRLGVSLLAPFLRGRAVVEAGCGTGRLAAAFLEAGAQSYLGLDHSAVAIAAARRRALPPTARFEVGSAAELPELEAIVVSLGLVDWLSDDELSAFFARHGERDFLHTFSERRGDAKQLVHRSLRSLDGWVRPWAVRPRYLSLEQLRARMPERRRGGLTVLRHHDLRYATFVSSLPIRWL